ncbi:MAG TPA: hypothetical protein PLL20_13530 [Phycisphaerae bacterium]|nr:hypothetical protein [Phycisphaerae bacterium]
MTSNAAATYTANDLNQYASTTYPTEAFAYDDDGNLTQDGTFDCTWDAGTLDATANAKRWSLWLAAPPPVVSRENRLSRHAADAAPPVLTSRGVYPLGPPVLTSRGDK